MLMVLIPIVHHTLEAVKGHHNILGMGMLCNAGVQYGSRNVLVDPELREEIKKFSQWPTIPQVFTVSSFPSWKSFYMVSCLEVSSAVSKSVSNAQYILTGMETCKGEIYVQIYVKGEFIGGSDLLMEMHQKGELDSVLKGEA